MYLPLCLTYFSFLVNSRLSTITWGHGLDTDNELKHESLELGGGRHGPINQLCVQT